MREREVSICEAQPEEAKNLMALLEQVQSESDFLTGSSHSPRTISAMTDFLKQSLASVNQICLLAMVDDELVGVLNVSASSEDWHAHVGDVFIAVAKPYWGYGLGTFLMEALIDWAENTPLIQRLELTVQKRNKRAVALYQKFDFVIEGTKRQAFKTKEGLYLDVYSMSRLMGNDDT